MTLTPSSDSSSTPSTSTSSSSPSSPLPAASPKQDIDDCGNNSPDDKKSEKSPSTSTSLFSETNSPHSKIINKRRGKKKEGSLTKKKEVQDGAERLQGKKHNFKLQIIAKEVVRNKEKEMKREEGEEDFLSFQQVLSSSPRSYPCSYTAHNCIDYSSSSCSSSKLTVSPSQSTSSTAPSSSSSSSSSTTLTTPSISIWDSLCNSSSLSTSPPAVIQEIVQLHVTGSYPLFSHHNYFGPCVTDRASSSSFATSMSTFPAKISPTQYGVQSSAFMAPTMGLDSVLPMMEVLSYSVCGSSFAYSQLTNFCPLYYSAGEASAMQSSMC
jgi:hypothetical protein